MVINMKFFHVYNDDCLKGLEKNGLINKDTGFKIQHCFAVPKERLFNNYAKVGGKLHSIIIRAEGFPISSQEIIKAVKEATGQDIKLVVLSYLQGGGSPSVCDRLFATEAGEKAVELLRDGFSFRAIGEYAGKVAHFDLAKALEAKRTPREDLLESIKVLVCSDAHSLGNISEAENAIDVDVEEGETDKKRAAILKYISES
jgi:hypothetical protein